MVGSPFMLDQLRNTLHGDAGMATSRMPLSSASGRLTRRLASALLHTYTKRLEDCFPHASVQTASALPACCRTGVQKILLQTACHDSKVLQRHCRKGHAHDSVDGVLWKEKACPHLRWRPIRKASLRRAGALAAAACRSAQSRASAAGYFAFKESSLDAQNLNDVHPRESVINRSRAQNDRALLTHTLQRSVRGCPSLLCNHIMSYEQSTCVPRERGRHT